MAPAYREDGYLIIQPGSQHTLVRFGLDDTLRPPSFSIPTKVYKKSIDSELFTISSDDESLAIYPIVKGEVVDVDALNFLLKSILKSLLNSNPLVLLNNIALLLVQTSSNWSNLAIETITKYVFEDLHLTAFTIVPAGLSSMFAYGSFANSCVIDIGYEKTEITPIVDFQVYIPSLGVLNKGGNFINDKLAKSLPHLTSSQIESLKRSNIFESLNAEDAKNSFFGTDALNESKSGNGADDEGVLDIAAIVTSEKSTREILAEQERQKKTKNKKVIKKSNSELEKNSFVDRDGQTIEVGKERFQCCSELIESIAATIYKSLSKIPDLSRRQECYDNLILVGSTAKITGFKEALLYKLYESYSVGYELDQMSNKKQASTGNFRNAHSAFRNDALMMQSKETVLNQVPKHIKFVSKPEYFSEWKNTGFEDCSFLGGEILAKQTFGTSANSEMFMVKEDYQEKGPMGIWHVRL